MQVKFSRPSTFDIQQTPDWLNETKHAMIKHWSKIHDEFSSSSTPETDYAGCLFETVQITNYQSFDIVYRYNVLTNGMEVRVIAYH